MRILRCLACSLLLLQSAWAADLAIKVVDPQSAVIPGASVLLLRAGSSTPLAVHRTSAAGADEAQMNGWLRELQMTLEHVRDVAEGKIKKN